MLDVTKNLPNEIKLDEEVWFCDESRFGTRSKVGHGWFKKSRYANLLDISSSYYAKKSFITIKI